MRKYNRVIGTFMRKVTKLEKIYEKNEKKISKYLEKAFRIKARIDLKISKLEDKNAVLEEEAAACSKTANKIKDLLT